MRLGTLALTAIIGLGVVGLASADESANWFTRWFARPAEKMEKTEPTPTSNSEMPKKSLASQRKFQEATLYRRQEVCQRLREVAAELDDADLARKADLLDQRAWDAYTAATNRLADPDRGAVDADAKKAAKGDRK